MIILEPRGSIISGVNEPLLQLCCLDVRFQSNFMRLNKRLFITAGIDRNQACYREFQNSYYNFGDFKPNRAIPEVAKLSTYHTGIIANDCISTLPQTTDCYKGE